MTRGHKVVRCGNKMSISDTPVSVATTWTPSTARRRGLSFLCPCLCRVQPTDTSRGRAPGGQIDHDRLPCCLVQSADTTHRCAPGVETRQSCCALADVFQFSFCTLAFGRLSLSRWTPPVHVEFDRKQFFTIELDLKIVVRDRALMPGSSRTRARSAKSSPRTTTSSNFLHRCTGRKASNTLQAITPSAEP